MKSLLSYKNYVISSEKPWVVFIHGIGGDIRTFSLQIKAFKPFFNLLLPNLRGHGASTNMVKPESGKYSFRLIAEDVFALMESLNIERAHFIGCSFGATLIREMQDMYPAKFISVVVSGCVLRLNGFFFSALKLAKFLGPYVNNYFLFKIMAYIIMPKKNHAKSRELFLKISRNIPPCEFISWIVLIDEIKYKLDELFNKPFTSPVLLINGSEDYTFIQDCILFCKINPTTQMDIIPNCGHLTNIDRYCEFNEKALNFLIDNS
ncbi:MAG: alpha/beta hydrolase [Bacteroidales bacterium]|nr:alpha/beta hydrolase [Bacteroidales bacterium]